MCLTNRRNPVAAGNAVIVLQRVLDAFQARVRATLGGTAAGRLSENVAVTRAMAMEPAAVLAGDPVAFFTGRQDDNLDVFVTEIIRAGETLLCVNLLDSCSSMQLCRVPISSALTASDHRVRLKSGTISVKWTSFPGKGQTTLMLHLCGGTVPGYCRDTNCATWTLKNVNLATLLQGSARVAMRWRCTGRCSRCSAG